MTSPLQVVKKAVAKHLKPSKDDELLVDYVIAVIASQFLNDAGDPLWGWVIGPPGSMKTEFLRSLNKHPETAFLSSLTPQSLVSGYEREDGEDPSLLPTFDGKIVVIKEFTSVIQLPEASVRQIFGDLRGIYDGSHGKGFGTVGIRRYESRFSMLAAVTTAIDQYTLVHTDLGERFIAFRLCRNMKADSTDRLAVVKHVLNVMDTKATWRSEITKAVHAAIDYCKNNVLDIGIPDRYVDDLLDMADLLALLRTQADCDGNPVLPELGTRVVQQLAHLAKGRAAADGRKTVNEDDMALVARVCWDTLPAPVSRLVSFLYSRKTDGGLVPETTLKFSAGLHPRWWQSARIQYSHVGVLRKQGDNVSMNNDFRTRLFRSRLRPQIEFRAANTKGVKTRY